MRGVGAVGPRWRCAAAGSALVLALAGCSQPNEDDLVVALIDAGTVSAAVRAATTVTIHGEGPDHVHTTAMAAIVLGLGEGQEPLSDGRLELRTWSVPFAQPDGPARLAAALDEAVDTGAEVVCIAMGTRRDSPDLAAAVRRATGRGVVVVAAAGNVGPLTADYPARYDSVVSVEATDGGTRAHFSADGDVGAPGVEVPTLAPDGSPAVVTGTSPAAALVTHQVVQAALTGRLEPDLDPDVVVRGVVDLPRGRGGTT